MDCAACGSVIGARGAFCEACGAPVERPVAGTGAERAGLTGTTVVIIIAAALTGLATLVGLAVLVREFLI